MEIHLSQNRIRNVFPKEFQVRQSGDFDEQHFRTLQVFTVPISKMSWSQGWH